MAATLTATLDIDDRQLRVEHTDARRALEVVTGQELITARARLRYGPGRTCEALARVLDTAIVRAEHAGLDPARLLIAGGAVEPDEDIVRVRRKAHGKADWIHSPTSHVRITLQPAGLHATQPPPAAPLPGRDQPASRSRPADAPLTATTPVRAPSATRCSRSSTPTSASTSSTSASSGRSGPRTARPSSP